MSDFFHGIKTKKNPTSLPQTVTVESGIAFLVGTAPVHTVSGTVNEPVMASTYDEAVAAFGYSSSWKDYDICEMTDSLFRRYKKAPVVFVNVLDPAKHKKAVAATAMDVTSGTVTLPLEAILSTVTVKSADGATTYKAEEDYALAYEGEVLLLEVLENGTIGSAVKLQIGYSAVDPTLVTKSDIIGGYNVTTQKYSGLELIDMVFPKYRITPDLILAPNWSGDADVAAVMDAKAENINGMFEAKALIDADCEGITYYGDVAGWKNSKSITSPRQIVYWPQVAQEDRQYRLSVQAACLIAKVDGDNDGVPSESPSNKTLEADSVVLADGTPVYLDLTKANALNAQGIVTTMNGISGFVLWGNNTACYPENPDMADYFISMSRMFAWEAKAVTLRYWSKVDRKMTKMLLESIVNEENQQLAALVTAGHLLGGRIEFLASDNLDLDLAAGKAKFRIYMAPCPPMECGEFILELDTSYMSVLTAA